MNQPPFANLLFGFINDASRGVANVSSAPPPNEYLKEGVESIEECINSLKYIKEYIPRLNSVIVPKYGMDCGSIEHLDTQLRTYLHRLPKNCTEWVQQWTNYIESFNIKCSNTGDCVICTASRCELIQFKCNCKASNMCLQCILNTWYTSTDGLMRSSISCPLCKKNMKFDDVLESVKLTYQISR